MGASEMIFDEGFEVALVGKVGEVISLRTDGAGDFGKGGGNVGDVMEDADGKGGVEGVVGKRQVVKVGGDKGEAGVVAQTVAGVLEHGTGVIEQDDLFVTAIKVGETSKARADFDEACDSFVPARDRGGGKFGGEGDALDLVFVGAPLPKFLAPARTFVIHDGGRILGHWRG